MKAGNVLTASEARKIAEKGGQVWLEMISYNPDDESYKGPVSFERVNGGYLLNAEEPAYDEFERNVKEAAALFVDVDPDIKGFSFPITDIDFDDFDDSERLSHDFGEGRMVISKLIED